MLSVIHSNDNQSRLMMTTGNSESWERKKGKQKSFWSRSTYVAHTKNFWSFWPEFRIGCLVVLFVWPDDFHLGYRITVLRSSQVLCFYSVYNVSISIMLNWNIVSTDILWAERSREYGRLSHSSPHLMWLGTADLTLAMPTQWEHKSMLHVNGPPFALSFRAYSLDSIQ